MSIKYIIKLKKEIWALELLNKINYNLALTCIDELYLIETSETYAKHIGYNKDANDLFELFIWSKSINGTQFWKTIYEKIN